jgi:hypothetical protein
MVASKNAIGNVYAILKNHLDDEQIDAILHDMLHASGNKSFRETVGALMNLHQVHSMRKETSK